MRLRRSGAGGPLRATSPDIIGLSDPGIGG
jgi:hypothetical protein